MPGGLGLRHWIACYLKLEDSALWHGISSLPQVVVDARSLKMEEKKIELQSKKP